MLNITKYQAKYFSHCLTHMLPANWKFRQVQTEDSRSVKRLIPLNNVGLFNNVNKITILDI